MLFYFYYKYMHVYVHRSIKIPRIHKKTFREEKEGKGVLFHRDEGDL